MSLKITAAPIVDFISKSWNSLSTSWAGRIVSQGLNSAPAKKVASFVTVRFAAAGALFAFSAYSARKAYKAYKTADGNKAFKKEDKKLDDAKTKTDTAKAIVSKITAITTTVATPAILAIGSLVAGVVALRKL